MSDKMASLVDELEKLQGQVSGPIKAALENMVAKSMKATKYVTWQTKSHHYIVAYIFPSGLSYRRYLNCSVPILKETGFPYELQSTQTPMTQEQAEQWFDLVMLHFNVHIGLPSTYEESYDGLPVNPLTLRTLP